MTKKLLNINTRIVTLRNNIDDAMTTLDNLATQYDENRPDSPCDTALHHPLDNAPYTALLQKVTDCTHELESLTHEMNLFD